MKQLFVILAILIASYTNSYAQKLAFVDTEYILSEMKDYQNAQKKLDGVVARWKGEIEQRYQEIDNMYKRFQAEQVLLSENDKARREQEIVDRENQVRSFQREKFGEKGALFQERQKLIRPIQDKVYGAVESVVGKKSLDFVLDKSSGAAILFANPKFDITKDVFRELGINK